MLSPWVLQCVDKEERPSVKFWHWEVYHCYTIVIPLLYTYYISLKLHLLLFFAFFKRPYYLSMQIMIYVPWLKFKTLLQWTGNLKYQQIFYCDLNVIENSMTCRIYSTSHWYVIYMFQCHYSHQACLVQAAGFHCYNTFPVQNKV